MKNEASDLMSLSTAARRLGVPARWLRAEALAGKIPHLRAGSRVLVNLDSLRALLLSRAAAHVEEEVRDGAA
jgi:excisionase family DNA binding protein